MMLDIMLTNFTDNRWHYKRNPSIGLPLNEAYRMSETGLPYLCPQAVLLFKACAESGKAPRAKDELDFNRVLPTLTIDEQEWLYQSIAMISPNHPWLAVIKSSVNSQAVVI